jgi:hypothetical protein
MIVQDEYYNAVIQRRKRLGQLQKKQQKVVGPAVRKKKRRH